jgi:hypothetical protein
LLHAICKKIARIAEPRIGSENTRFFQSSPINNGCTGLHSAKASGSRVQPKISNNPVANHYDEGHDVPPISNVRSLPGAGLRNVACHSQ